MQRNALLGNAFCPPATAECACAALRNKDGGRPCPARYYKRHVLSSERMGKSCRPIDVEFIRKLH
jgi:hypothetical protein